MNVHEIKEFVLTETPCYKFKAALKSLEDNKQRITVVKMPPKRKPGAYPDDQLRDIVLTFERSLF
jgi:hypothetical protein